MSNKINSFMPVPVLNIEVTRRQLPQLSGPPVELSETHLDGYYVLPETCRGGSSTRKMTFSEVIQYFIV